MSQTNYERSVWSVRKTECIYVIFLVVILFIIHKFVSEEYRLVINSIAIIDFLVLSFMLLKRKSPFYE